MKKGIGYLVLAFMFIMLIRFVGFTYGFYSTIINGNQADKSLSVNSKYLAVVYTDGTAVMNFDGDYLFPGNGAEKTFSVENTGDDTTTYNILIDNVQNEFERIQDLRYDLYINDELIVDDGAINNNEVQYLYFGRSIAVDATDKVRFVFTYAETEEVQNVDMNKGISFRFNISSDLYNQQSSETNSVIFTSSEADLNSYRIYGNTLQNDTSTEQSVGDVTKNLINDNRNKVASTGLTLITADSKLSLNGGNSASAVQVIYHYSNNDSLILKAGVSYTLSLQYISGSLDTLSSSAMYFGLKDTSSAWVTNSTKGITLTNYKNKLYVTFSVDVDTQVSFGFVGSCTASNLVFGIQLEEGTVATEYEPYGKYKIPVSISGKNLFSIDNMNDKSGTASIEVNSENEIIAEMNTSAENVSPGSTNWSSGWVNLQYVLAANTTYTVSYDVEYLSVPDNVSYPIPHGIYTDNSFVIKSITGINKVYRNSGKITTDATGLLKIILTCNSSKIKISNIQIEKGTVATEYEPFIGNLVIANIYLDEPLRKVGTNADYIDFGRQILVRYGSDNIISSEVPIKLPAFKTYSGTNIFEVDTLIAPSGVYVESLK